MELSEEVFNMLQESQTEKSQLKNEVWTLARKVAEVNLELPQKETEVAESQNLARFYKRCYEMTQNEEDSDDEDEGAQPRNQKPNVAHCSLCLIPRRN
jgi:hypothetical protein